MSLQISERWLGSTPTFCPPAVVVQALDARVAADRSEPVVEHLEIRDDGFGFVEVVHGPKIRRKKGWRDPAQFA